MKLEEALLSPQHSGNSNLRNVGMKMMMKRTQMGNNIHLGVALATPLVLKIRRFSVIGLNNGGHQEVAKVEEEVEVAVVVAVVVVVAAVAVASLLMWLVIPEDKARKNRLKLLESAKMPTKLQGLTTTGRVRLAGNRPGGCFEQRQKIILKVEKALECLMFYSLDVYVKHCY